MIGDDPWPSFIAYSDETQCAEYLSAHDICVSLPLIKKSVRFSQETVDSGVGYRYVGFAQLTW